MHAGTVKLLCSALINTRGDGKPGGIHIQKRTYDETGAVSSKDVMFNDRRVRLGRGYESMRDEGDADGINVREVERVREYGNRKKEMIPGICDLLCTFGCQQETSIAEYSIGTLYDKDIEMFRFRETMRSFGVSKKTLSGKTDNRVENNWFVKYEIRFKIGADSYVHNSKKSKCCEGADAPRILSSGGSLVLRRHRGFF